MVRKFFILLAISLHDLLLPGFQAAMNVLLSAVFVEHPVKHKKVLAVPDVLRGNGIKISPGVGQVIDRIEYIGLAYAVVADKTIDLLVEVKANLIEILEID
mgnify:FL=1